MAAGPSEPKFTLGDRVHLKSDAAWRGAVVGGPRAQPDGFEYEVMASGHAEAWYAESLLQKVPSSDRPQWQPRDALPRDLVLAKLKNPLSDSLYAYRASRTVFEPYQFRPALKFLGSDQQGLLIADEVGLGKTIEAAIIYLELKARMDISRVVVLCPSRLTKKWQDELRNRFEEEFEILDAPRVRRWFEDYQRLGAATSIRAIASFELLRRADFVEQFVEQNIPLDLLIVDEAHHLRNETSATYRLGATLVNAADVVLLLTATPLHLRNQDLYNLLNLLAPEDFNAPDLFEQQIQPNEHINQASRQVAAGDLRAAHHELRKVEATLLRDRYLKDPYYLEVVAQLADRTKPPSHGDKINIQREFAS